MLKYSITIYYRNKSLRCDVNSLIDNSTLLYVRFCFVIFPSPLKLYWEKLYGQAHRKRDPKLGMDTKKIPQFLSEKTFKSEEVSLPGWGEVSISELKGWAKQVSSGISR